jgi:squalene synthase HpnD
MTAAHSAVSPMEAVQQKAAGSSFYSAMRLMPKSERQAMFAIYAFCRMVDDIADNGIGTRDERRRELHAWRFDLAQLYAGRGAMRSAFLADTIRQYGLRQEDFVAVIDGMEMDVTQDIRGPDLATLDLYCERVASAVGRLSIKVFGMDEVPGFALAHHLGRALQLTNILRDIDEDAAIGRLYLPREHLESAGIPSEDPTAAIAKPEIDWVCREVKSRPRGRIRTPRLMGAVYREILRRTEIAGWEPPRVRVSLPKSQLLLMVLRHGLA